MKRLPLRNHANGQHRDVCARARTETGEFGPFGGIQSGVHTKREQRRIRKPHHVRPLRLSVPANHVRIKPDPAFHGEIDPHDTTGPVIFPLLARVTEIDDTEKPRLPVSSLHQLFPPSGTAFWSEMKGNIARIPPAHDPVLSSKPRRHQTLPAGLICTTSIRGHIACPWRNLHEIGNVEPA